MRSMGMGLRMGISTVAILIFGFIFFFLMSAIYFLFARFVLKGEGTYTSVLVASGLTSYIGIIMTIIAAILAMTFGRMVNDTSLAALTNADRFSYMGWLQAKIDPISIWANIVLGIGLAKMFKSVSTGKYIALVFGIWLIGGFLLLVIGQAVPFFKMFMGPQ